MGDTAALVGQVSGTVGSVVSGIRSASADQRQAQIEGKQAIINAGLQEQQSRYQTAKVLSKSRAIAGASGVDPSSGTPMDVYMDTVKQGELEALTIRQGGKIAQNRALYRAWAAGQRIPGAIAGGTSQLGTIFSKPENQSILQNLWAKATGP